MPELTCTQWMKEWRRCIGATDTARAEVEECWAIAEDRTRHEERLQIGERQRQMEAEAALERAEKTEKAAGRAFLAAWDKVNDLGPDGEVQHG